MTEESNLATDSAKRGPGRPPKSGLAAQPFYDAAGASDVQKEPVAPKPKFSPVADAIEVDKAVTADASLPAGAAQTEGETLEQAIARIRQIRQPFGAMSQKLALPTRPGYHRHWFNDTAGRIDEASASGWSHIMNPRDGKPQKRVVGTGRDNGALYAYAMEIPKVFWDDMMNDRHEVAQSKIDSIKKNPFQAKAGEAKASDKGKFYDPNESTGAGPLQVVKG